MILTVEFEITYLFRGLSFGAIGGFGAIAKIIIGTNTFVIFLQRYLSTKSRLKLKLFYNLSNFLPAKPICYSETADYAFSVELINDSLIKLIYNSNTS